MSISSAPRRSKARGAYPRESGPGYLMTTPYLIHFAAFMAFPLIFSIILVFHKWNVITPMKWVGLANFRRVIRDDLFFQSLWNTLVFLVIHIPLQMIIALTLAVMLNQAIRFRSFFRAIYFMPVIVSGIATTILWQQMFGYDTGVLNTAATKIGLPRIPWLIDAGWAMPSIALMATWKNVGLYIVLFLVGLQAIPRQLYEAAEVDGATPLQCFRFITVPSLRNTLVLIAILSTLGGFSLFIEPFVMTGGGPMNATLSVMLYIYNLAFSFGHMGYAATLGLLYALIMLISMQVIRWTGEVRA
jgi:multiple sugar transport system permease protein